VDVLEKEIYNYKADVKLDHLQRTTNHIIQVKGIAELNRLVVPYFWENVDHFCSCV